jgi:hypothetical protein
VIDGGGGVDSWVCVCVCVCEFIRGEMHVVIARARKRLQSNRQLRGAHTHISKTHTHIPTSAFSGKEDEAS